MSNDAGLNSIKRFLEITGNQTISAPNLPISINSDDILFGDIYNQLANPSFSPDEQQIVFDILQAADTNEDGVTDKEELSMLTSLSDDGDDGEYLTQNDIDIFVNEANNAAIVDNYLNQKNTEITMAYLGKPIEECTDDEYYYCYTLHTVENELMASEMAFNDQVASDGWLSDGYDWVKETTGWFGGIDRKEVHAAIDKQRKILDELKDVLKNGGDFEAEYERLTGVAFDKETIAYYVEEKTTLEMCAIGTTKAAYFTQSLDDKYAYEIFQEYVQYYGNEKLAMEKFEEDLNYVAQGILTPDCSYNITDDYQLQIVYSDHVVDIGSIKDGLVWLSAFDNFNTKDFTEYKQNEFIESFEKSTGIKYSELVENYNHDAQWGFGELYAVGNLVNEYIASQESFIDVAGSLVQFAGMAMIAVGGVVFAIPGGKLLGAAVFKVGQIVSVAGSFVDDGLEVFDTITNNQWLDKDAKHYLDIGKEIFTDAALIASGYAIGSYTGSVADDLIQAGKNRAYAKLVDIGLDSTLSMATDLILTGEVDFSSEGISQFFGLLTGLTISRANNVKVKSNNSPDLSLRQTHTKSHSEVKTLDNKFLKDIDSSAKINFSNPELRLSEAEVSLLKNMQEHNYADGNLKTNFNTVSEIVRRINNVFSEYINAYDFESRLQQCSTVLEQIRMSDLTDVEKQALEVVALSRVVPKTDTHFHTKGALSQDTVEALMKKHNATPQEFADTLAVFDKGMQGFDNLEDFCANYGKISRWVRDAEDLSLMTYDNIMYAAKNNIPYIELRNATIGARNLTPTQVLDAMMKGRQRALAELGDACPVSTITVGGYRGVHLADEIRPWHLGKITDSLKAELDPLYVETTLKQVDGRTYYMEDAVEDLISNISNPQIREQLYADFDDILDGTPTTGRIYRDIQNQVGTNMFDSYLTKYGKFDSAVRAFAADYPEVDLELSLSERMAKAYSNAHTITESEITQTVDFMLENAAKPEYAGVLTGIDLNGPETHSSFNSWSKQYERIAQYNANNPDARIGITIHAGETSKTAEMLFGTDGRVVGSETIDSAGSIVDAVNSGAVRIGHGLQLYNNPETIDWLVKNHPEVVIETNPTCNILSIPQGTEGMNAHPIDLFSHKGLKTVICSDDPAICMTDVSQEVAKVWLMNYEVNGAYGIEGIKRAELNGIESGFMPANLKVLLTQKMSYQYDRIDTLLK